MSGSLNQFIWDIVNAAGWWWWIPCWALSIKNMIWLANLSAPATFIGRVARTFAWLAHIPMGFLPLMNSMGLIALPLMLIANNILYIQLWLACRAQRGQPVLNAGHMARRVLQSMVAPQ